MFSPVTTETPTPEQRVRARNRTAVAFALGAMIGLLSVTDAFLTVTLFTDGAEETNLLLAFVLNKHPQLFAAVKMALTGFGVVVLVASPATRSGPVSASHRASNSSLLSTEPGVGSMAMAERYCSAASHHCCAWASSSP